MDAKRTSNPDEMMLTLSPADAQDINNLVNQFTHWELIASAENQEPMRFMLRFSRDCENAIQGFPTENYRFERGQVLLTTAELSTLADFLRVCVDSEGDRMSWMKRTMLKMASKTLRNRVA